jgi:hypothetical protein
MGASALSGPHRSEPAYRGIRQSSSRASNSPKGGHVLVELAPGADIERDGLAHVRPRTTGGHREGVIEGGDRIAVPVRVHAPAKNGKSVVVRNVWIYEFSDGRLTRGRVYADTAVLRDALITSAEPRAHS